MTGRLGETLVVPARGRTKAMLDPRRRLMLEIEGESPHYNVALYEDDHVLGGVSTVENYPEATFDVLRAYAPEDEPVFRALLGAARA